MLLKKIYQSLIHHRILLLVLCSLSCFFSISAQKITGTVFDESNVPMIGVSISIKGAKIGTVSDINGKFELSGVNDKSILEFRFLGYLVQEVQIKRQSVLNIWMKTDTKSLDEVVVVGYGQQRRQDVTGSLASVSMKDVGKAPVGNFTEALSGRIAGVVITSPDGQPGALQNIVIRGSGSITQDNNPLWVIDGFPIENFNSNSINQNDIETIDILKDASATAIYGARGSNGVILVTTKKGKLGKPVVTFDMSMSRLDVTKKMDLMDPVQYLQYQNERDIISNNLIADPNTGSMITLTDYYYLKFGTYDDYKKQRINLQDYMFQPSIAQNYNLSLRGGDNKTTYYLSGSYHDSDGIMINTGFNRKQGKIVLDQFINDKIKVGINVNYTDNLQNGASPLPDNISGYWASTMSPFFNLWGTRPASPLREDGTPSFDLLKDFYDPGLTNSDSSNENSYLVNPIINQRNQYDITKTSNLTANGYITITFNKHLTLRSNFGFSSENKDKNQFYNSLTIQGSPITATGKTKGNNGLILNQDRLNLTNENYLTYNTTIKKNHSLSLTGLMSEQVGDFRTNGMAASQCPNENLGISGLDEGTPLYINSTSSKWSLVSFMARVNYNYKYKYYLTLTNRMDGSSKFSQTNRWGNFTSGAFKWNFMKEEFIKPLTHVLSNGSFRASIGQTGNNRVSDFVTYSTMDIGQMVAPYSFNNSIPTSAKQVVSGNSNLKWETTTQSNIGVDLDFFKDRIKISADYYIKQTDNLLLNKNTSPVTGYPNVMANIGSLQNKGLELTINTVNIETKNFEWTSSFNISWNQNKILSLGNDQESLSNSVWFDMSFANSPAYISKVGHPIGQMYGLVWEGNYQYSDFNHITMLNPFAAGVDVNGSHWLLKDNVPTNGRPRTAIQPGDIKYRDINGDGIVDQNDFTIIGRGTPIHTGGFGNNFKFWNFDLNLFFQWSYGNNIQNANRIVFEGNTTRNNLNQFASYVDRWTPDNTDSKNFRVAGGGTYGYYSSRTVEDGSYLKLKTLSFGYNVSKKDLLKLKIKSLRIYLSAQNLFTLTKYTGLDPEVSTYNSVLTPGFDWSAYPKSRTLAAGISIEL